PGLGRLRGFELEDHRLRSGRRSLDRFGGDVKRDHLSAGRLDRRTGGGLVLAVELRILHDVLRDEVCRHDVSSSCSQISCSQIAAWMPSKKCHQASSECWSASRTRVWVAASVACRTTMLSPTLLCAASAVSWRSQNSTAWRLSPYCSSR